MAKQNINVGTTANDKKGDSLRAAFQKVNANFTELYEAVGLATTGQDTALTFLGSTLSTDDSSSIVIDRATTVTSDLTVGGDVVPQTANGGDLGSSTLPWRSLYVSNNTIYIGGTAVGINQLGQLTVAGSQVNSVDRLSNSGDEVVLFGGANPFTLFPAITGGDQLQIQGSEVSTVSGHLALTSQNNLYIIANGSGAAPGGSKNWTFSDDGNLTLPAGGDIKDSIGTSILNRLSVTGSSAVLTKDQYDTTRLTFTGGATIETAGYISGVGGLALVDSSAQNYVGTDTGRVEIITGFPDGGTGVDSFNQWQFLKSGVLSLPKDGIIENNGKQWRFGTDGALTIPGDIRSEGNINIDINLSDSTLRRWQFGEDGHLTLPAGGDIKDSTGTSVLGGGSVSSLVNGAYTVSLGSTGTLTVPANGIITAPINQEFQLQAKDTTSALRNEINLDPNNGTYMSVWGVEDSDPFFISDWATASWVNEGGVGGAYFTNAETLQDFWTTGIGSFVYPIEVAINGGTRTPVQYDGNNGEQFGVALITDAFPVSSPTTITSLVFYYRTKNSIDIDYANGRLLLKAQSIDINLETSNTLNLQSGQNLNIRGQGAYPVRIYTDDTTHKWEFDTTGSLTLPREGKIYGIGDGVAAGDRYGYISWDGNSSGDGSGFNTMRLVPDLQGLEDLDQYIIIDPTGGVPGHIHIRAGGTQDNSLADLYLGGENSHVKISAGANPPVTVKANSNSWIFGTDGRTTFPNGVVPAHSYGAAGDKEGMIVFTDPYIYYCKQDYVDNSTDIWVRVAWTGTNW